MDFLNVMKMNFRVQRVKTQVAVARLSKKLGLWTCLKWRLNLVSFGSVSVSGYELSECSVTCEIWCACSSVCVIQVFWNVMLCLGQVFADILKALWSLNCMELLFQQDNSTLQKTWISRNMFIKLRIDDSCLWGCYAILTGNTMLNHVAW